MMLYKAGPSSSAARTEFEILRESHKFLREDGEKDAEPHTWEDKLAQKYYDTLFREYAVCDLKHYKSGNFALRWRTESEVISGAGETTCGNTRCPKHSPRNHDPEDGPLPGLKTLELPFAYVEKGENKMALVKVVLCDKCCKKLMWKRNKEKERQREAAQASGQRPLAEKEMTKDTRVAENATDMRVKQEDMPEPTLSPPRHRHHHVGEPSTRHRSDRSRSPRRRSHDERSRRRKSP